MEVIGSFTIAFIFSFIGSIPPGTLNLTIIQLGLEHKINIAWRFALAASLIEYPYAWLAIEFESVIINTPGITENIKVIAAVVMVVLGIFHLWTSTRLNPPRGRFSSSGFRKGLFLGLLNPLALPFWIAMTAYIKSQRWTDLSSDGEIHGYLAGVSLGALTVFMLLAYMARKVVSQFQGTTILKKIPGMVLIGLGLYALVKYSFRVLNG